MALPQFFLQELKSRCDIGEIASSYVNLKRRGKNLVGLCPFHNEKTPSFNIYPDNGSFYCFGCSTGGDIITFIMKIENLDYIEAVRFLVQRAGMQMPEDGVDDSMARLKSRILEINRESARFFHRALLSETGAAALAYLRRRQLDDKTIKHFGLGYAPGGGFMLVNHLKTKGYTAAEMVQANVAGMSKNGNPYDRFKARVMFPIIDLRGNVVAFGGRILTDEKPKYINTSDTPVYHKSSGLFAMNFAKDAGRRQLILAEGYMDVISLHKAGFTNAIASLGTSLTEEQARIIARYADEAVICYDSDEAGQRATQRAIPILKRTGLFVKVLTVPGNKDPDEFMLTYGDDGPLRFQQLLEKSGSDIEYRLFKLKSGYDLETAEGKVRYLQDAVKTLADIDDKMALDIYAGILSGETDVEKGAIKEMAEKAQKQNRRARQKQEIKEQSDIRAVKSYVNKEKEANTRAANAEEGVISFIFKHPDKLDEIKRQLPVEKFVTSFNRRVYALLLGKTIYGDITLTNFSGDLTGEEMSELTRILAMHSEVPVTWDDVREYIRVILREKDTIGLDKVKTASNEEILDYLQNLKNQKTGGMN